MTYVWNPKADPEERVRVLKGFMGAMMARVFEDIGDQDEYGLDLGWEPADVYNALNDS